MLSFLASAVPPAIMGPSRNHVAKRPKVKGLTSGRKGYHRAKAQNDIVKRWCALSASET